MKPLLILLSLALAVSTFGALNPAPALSAVDEADVEIMNVCHEFAGFEQDCQ